MCKSQAEGGQRCSAHTRARLDKATDNLALAAASGNSDLVASAREAWDTAAVEHASTREGRNEMRKQIADFEQSGETELAANHANIIRRGSDLSAANRAVAEAIRQANRPEVRTARDIAAGRYDMTDDNTAVIGSGRFVCENHNKPGSCDSECTQLITAMAGDDGDGIPYDPTGTTYGPDRPYTYYSYDVAKSATMEYIVTPLDCLDDTSRATVEAALAR